MEHIFSPQPHEKINLIVESSPVWELILGIAGYTHKQLRHTFELDEKWEQYQKSMHKKLVNLLNRIEETNFWYGLVMLQSNLSATTIQDFSNRLLEMPINSFYETLLPYSNRDSEKIRKEIANQYEQKDLFQEYATFFEGHEYLGSYVRSLSHYSYQETCGLLINTLEEWHQFVSNHEEWEKWIQALTFEQKQYNSLELTNPIEDIEKISGIKYIPEPSIWTVKLIPQVSYRPWVLELRNTDTKLFFYPLKEEYLLEPGVPSNELIRGHKALGDELRLKLLYQLLEGALSLQEMSMKFNTSKTTLHHQLSLLKAAKFVSVNKGVYSANLSNISGFTEKLMRYLGNHE
jgi:hypothetical protein